MLRPVGDQAADVTPLFRERAVTQKRHRLPGPVAVISAPGFSHVLLVALLSLGLVAAALYLIEIPLRSRAVGVLMPHGGILHVASAAPGRVTAIAISEGDVVAKGQLLLALSTDRSSKNVPSLAAAQLESLRSELAILAMKQKENGALNQAIASDVALRLAAMSRRRDLAKKEVDVFEHRLLLLASRVHRLESLADNGGIAPDRLEQLRSEFLAVQREQLASERSIVELDLEKQRVMSSIDRTAIESRMLDLETDAQRARLTGQISKVSVEQSHRVLAPRSGKVIRIGVTEGAVIAAGYPLLALVADGAEWEAWLYVSAQEAGQLQSGQEIEIRLDAYPHQLFGTVTATISTVTRLAVLPRELSVPIPVTGAVFEVRAQMSQPLSTTVNHNALPGVGASFTADIIKHRYRLYEWLLRSRSTLAGPERV